MATKIRPTRLLSASCIFHRTLPLHDPRSHHGSPHKLQQQAESTQRHYLGRVKRNTKTSSEASGQGGAWLTGAGLTVVVSKSTREHTRWKPEQLHREPKNDRPWRKKPMKNRAGKENLYVSENQI
jgi:hypothetical protein